MRVLEALSVKVRIGLVLIMAVIFIAGSALFEFYQFQKVRKLTENMYDHPVTVSRALMKIELNIVLIHREMKDIALGKDLFEAQHIVDNLHLDTLARFEVLKSQFLGEQSEIRNLEQLFVDWRQIRQKVITYRQLGHKEEAYRITTTEGADHIEKLTSLIVGIQNFADSKLEHFYGNAKNTAKRSEAVLLGIALISTVLFAVFSVLIAGSILHPLDKLSIFSKRLSSGDFRADMKVSGNNEIDQLGRDMLEMRDNLQALIIKIETANTQLIESEKLAALGGLVAGVAHEVNTPLGVSVTATSIIKEIRDELNRAFNEQTLTTEQFSRLLKSLTDSSDMLDDNVKRAARLIKDFKLTAVDQVSESQCTFHLQHILKALVSSLHPETRKLPVTPAISGDEALTMNSFPGVITQVISNLIMNSLNHAFENQPQPEIGISFTRADDNIILEYRDNGCGVDESRHESIFEPFYTTKKGQGGSGLGLSLVESLVEQKLQGKILFESEAGDGVHFTFVLPMVLK